MHSIEIVLSMLLLVLASGYLVRLLPFALPLPLVQIVLGAVVAAFSTSAVQLDPSVFFLVFLPPLLFLDGWRIPKEGLFRDARPILQLALGLVVFTVLGAGFFIHWLIPAMPLPVAFALAAVMSPTDPVAVSSIAKRAPVPKRLMHVLEGESLLNDASGLVCFAFAVEAAMTGQFVAERAFLTFLWVSLGGVGIGALASYALSRGHVWVSRRFGQDAGVPIVGGLLLPFAAYLLAEAIEASGILAAVAAGVTMSYVDLSGRTLATTRVQRAAVWDAVQFALTGIMFVLLGEQLPGILQAAAVTVQESGHVDPRWLLAYALIITAVLGALRFAWVWLSLRFTMWIARRRDEVVIEPGWRATLAMTLAGVRGAITLAGVLTLPLLLPDGREFPARELAILLAAAVVVISLLGATFALPRVLAGLALAPAPRATREETEARRIAARAAVRAIEHAQQTGGVLKGDPEICASAAVRVMSLYAPRLGDGPLSDVDAERLREADTAERILRVVALRAEREALFELVRQHRLSGDAASHLIRELDLLETRYT